MATSPLDSDAPVLLEPQTLQAARDLYEVYRSRTTRRRNPQGVVVNTSTCQAALTFVARPILLPKECFVPFQMIESEPTAEERGRPA